MKDRSTANLLLMLLAIAAFFLVGAVLWYVINFGTVPAPSREAWGQFGDYLGGTLNPVFGFLTLVAIVMTLAVQTRQLDLSVEQLQLSRSELEATREELRKSAEAQLGAVAAQREQVRFTALSARIAAVSAALAAIDEQLNRLRMPATGMAVRIDSAAIRERRESLQSKLDELLVQAEAV